MPTGAGNDNKVFDITKPGKTSAEPSSRPVIVGHKSMLKDPMVNIGNPGNSLATMISADLEPEDTPSGKPYSPPADEADRPGTAPALPRLGEQPPKSASVNIVDNNAGRTRVPPITPDDESAKKEAPKDDTPAQDSGAPKTTKSDTNEEKVSEPNEAAAVSATASQQLAQKQAEKEQQEITARKAAVEQLIAEKKHFVPIGTKIHRKRSVRHVLLGIVLILLLGIMLADILLDAKVININNFKPPVRIINR